MTGEIERLVSRNHDIDFKLSEDKRCAILTPLATVDRAMLPT
jgi:hypothetical protein